MKKNFSVKIAIRNCTLAYKCNAVWEELEETMDKDIHFCNDCQREVYFCNDDEDLVKNIHLNRCIAFERVSQGVEIVELGMPIRP